MIPCSPQRKEVKTWARETRDAQNLPRQFSGGDGGFHVKFGFSKRSNLKLRWLPAGASKEDFLGTLFDPKNWR